MLMMKLRVFKGEGAFGRARDEKSDEQMVCGTYDLKQRPVYFLMPKGAPDDEVQDTSFRIREGRGMGEAEREFVAAYHRVQADA